MNNRERFLTALHLGEPDRVPYFDYFNEESIVNTGKVLFGEDLPEMKSRDDRYKILDLYLKVARELDIDAVVTEPLHYESIPGKEDLIKDWFGTVYKVTKEGEPFPVEGAVKDASDLARLEGIRPTDADFRVLEYFKEKVPERATAVGISDPFKNSWLLLGALEKLLPLFVIDPDFCHKLARIATDFLKQEIEMAIDKGADVFFQDGDLAHKTNTLMSRDHFLKFIKPYYHELTETAHKQGVPIIKHSDGNIQPILDDIIEAGYDAIHPIEYQAMDIAEIKENLTGRACVIGNIDCMYLLPFGKKEEVVASVKETIQKVAPGGGYILSSSNSIHPGCKGENTVAMYQAAKKYGTYPIKIN